MLSAYVKFCGGCNPTYDRGKAVATLKKLFADQIEFHGYDPGIPRDVGIVVQGCERECVQLGILPQTKHLFVLRYEKDIADVIAGIRKLLEQ